MQLTKQVVRDLRDRLSEWQTPPEMKAIGDDVRERVSRESFFNKGGLTFLREAMVAADFGVARKALRIRLVPAIEERPDFELTFADQVERFEMVEADKKGRRRGDDYKALAQMPEGYVRHIGTPMPDQIVEMVETAAQKKAKPYPPGTQLLIYLNASRFRSDEELLNDFPDAVSAARPFFSAIWIMWQGKAHQIMPVR